MRTRIQKTSDALEQLKIRRRGKKKLTSIDEWESAVAAIFKRYHTTGLFHIDLKLQRIQKIKRRYLQRGSQNFEEISSNLDFKLDEDAVLREIQWEHPNFAL